MSFLLGTFLQSFQRSAFTILIRFRDILYKLVLVLLTSTVIVWLSVFLYGTFYYTYMPAVSHVKAVHLQFGWCGNESLCAYPRANVTLVRRGQEQLLMRGQQYKVYLDLEMPESPVNQKLGVFMVSIDFISRAGEVTHTSSRSAMLRYKSPLHQTLSTLFYTPLLLIGSAEEKQMIHLELCDFYEEDPARPAVTATIEIQNRNVEIYSSQLRIYAHFTGLRYLMFHWPVVSAIVGIGTNLFFLSIVALLSWYRYLVSHESHEVVVRVGFDESHTVNSIDKRRTQVKEFLMREKERQSRLKASFSAFDVTRTTSDSDMQFKKDSRPRNHAVSLSSAKEAADSTADLPLNIAKKEAALNFGTASDVDEDDQDEIKEATISEGILLGGNTSDVTSQEQAVETDDTSETEAALKMPKFFKSDYSLGPLRKRSFVEPLKK